MARAAQGHLSIARGAVRTLAALLIGLCLAGCEATAPSAPIAAPPPKPDRTAGTSPTPRPPQASAASRDLANHYARLQQELLTRGLLRRDGGGIDTPYTDRMLVDNFVRIALFDEHTTQGGRLISQQTPTTLRRWEVPVRVQLHFGPAIPDEMRRKDRAGLQALVGRLGRATRHPIVTVAGAANFHVLVLNDDERRNAGPLIESLLPGVDRGVIDVVETLPRSTYCLVFNFSRGPTSSISSALAVVRAENPDLLRLSCLHEEVTQGLGLTNDSPQARPSIFNDDEEFALLTTHDELLLRMLYDRRLTPGMTEVQVRPVAARIAAELLPGGS